MKMQALLEQLEHYYYPPFSKLGLELKSLIHYLREGRPPSVELYAPESWLLALDSPSLNRSKESVVARLELIFDYLRGGGDEKSLFAYDAEFNINRSFPYFEWNKSDGGVGAITDALGKKQLYLAHREEGSIFIEENESKLSRSNIEFFLLPSDESPLKVREGEKDRMIRGVKRDYLERLNHFYRDQKGFVSSLLTSEIVGFLLGERGELLSLYSAQKLNAFFEDLI